MTTDRGGATSDAALRGRIDGALYPVRIIRSYMCDGRVRLEVEVVSGTLKGRVAAGLDSRDDIEFCCPVGPDGGGALTPDDLLGPPR